MSKAKQAGYEPINASPVKSFFVSMLTRDIKLEDAILDLLDNCVDGILRTKGRRQSRKPYQGFSAEINFKRNSFMISDNCGGIPWNLHDYAFRMGRADGSPAVPPGGVGVYGIGMKRAIFKMGKHSCISTQNGDHQYEVEIKPEWISSEQDWRIPVKRAKKKMNEDGTTIEVGNLYPGIADLFSKDAAAFKAELERMVSTHYAFIIDKGFEVKINGFAVKPRPTRIVFSKKTHGKRVTPFIYKAKTDDGVDVFLSVGFTRPIPTQEEVMDAQDETRYSSIDAGWTIVCNDRAVVYCDRSELTGWGEASIPRYHTQFIAISGIVEFKSDNASKLPTTTTKRGIDASSPLFLQIKNKMREGIRIFIDFTNKWKGQAEESKRYIEMESTLSFDEIKTAAAASKRELKFKQTRKMPKGDQHKPELPLPKKLEPRKTRISFVSNKEDVKRVAEHLFDDQNADPSAVGKKCFDLFLREARK